MESLIIGMRLAGIKKVVYQAGSVQPYPGEKVAFSNKIWHFTLALYIGIAGNENDYFSKPPAPTSECSWSSVSSSPDLNDIDLNDSN